MNFSELRLHESLLKAVSDAGFEKPTPIQAQAIPQVMEGKDLLASAQTGTGKTAAFMLPILHRLMSEPGRGLQVLVLEPTRELALQVEDQVKLFGKYSGLRSITVYGGVALGPQEKALKDGVEIVAATPGRLLDHMRQGNVDATKLRVLVLDEVDRMLDMGFLPDVRDILRRLPADRQTLFFSATVPSEIGRLADGMLKDPAKVAIAPDRKTAEGITQQVFPVEEHLKPFLLGRLLDDEGVTSALVFTRTKIGADKVCAVVEKHGFSVERIHGDRSQKERQLALAAFKEGRVKFLVATDIAARGLDIEGISHVFNYDVPESPDDYVHRIGRTARAGATGHAYTLMSNRDHVLISTIENHLSMKLEKKMLENFDYNEELGPQHEIRQGHDVRGFDEKRRFASRASEGADSTPAPHSGSPSGPRSLRDADERATVIVRRLNDQGEPMDIRDLRDAGRPEGRGGEGRGGRDRGGRDRDRGRGGRDREGRGGRGGDRGDRGPREERPRSFDRGPREDRPARQSNSDQPLSATEVLRRAGQQRAAVEGSALDLRPVRETSGPDSYEPEMERAPQETFSRAPLGGGGSGGRERQERINDGGPRRDGQMRESRDGGRDGGRRRRNRGGRGRFEGERQDRGGQQHARPQGQGQHNQNRQHQGGQQGGRGQGRFNRDQRPQPKPSGGGLWSKIKGVLGLGSSSSEGSGKW